MNYTLSMRDTVTGEIVAKSISSADCVDVYEGPKSYMENWIRFRIGDFVKAHKNTEITLTTKE